ncbi:MAG: hypothetical protein WDA07_06290 [Leucobacter sp.]
MTLPTIHRLPLDLSRFLTIPGFYASGRYYRGQNLARITGATTSITAIWSDMATGGGKPALPAGTYTVFADGQKIGEQAIDGMGTSNRLDIPIDANLLRGSDKQWVEIKVVASNGLASIVWPMFVNLDDTPVTEQPAVIPVVGTSHALASGPAKGRYRWAWIPKERIGKAKPCPLVPRPAEPFSDTPDYRQLHRTNIVVPVGEDNHRFNVTRDGTVTTWNKQNYFWSDLIEQYPKQHQLDGPRGVGAINLPTHIEPSRNGGCHVVNPWRLARISPDGTVKTLVGWYHDPLPIYHGDTEGKNAVLPKLAGDWSQVKGPLGFWETWGFCWRTPSLAINEAAEKIGGERNLHREPEHPHYAPGPQGFLADARHGRVLKFQFPHDDHREPVVTEFITGLNDPWDIRYRKSTDTIIVSERQSNRIVEYSATTGELVRVILQGAEGKARVVLPSRFVQQLVGTDIIRREDVVLPEGIDLLEHEAEEWLYYGSVAMREVRRVNLNTGEIQHVAYPIYTSGQSHFYKIAVSDGSFGPAGTCFVTSWTIARHGFPQAFLPGGGEWKIHSFGRAIQGFPNVTETMGYGCAVGVGRAANGDAGGRLFCGGSHDGIVMVTKALPGDERIDANKIARGRTQFFARDLDLLFADSASIFGYEPPFGENEDLDYYLRHLGYVPAAEQPPAEDPKEPEEPEDPEPEDPEDPEEPADPEREALLAEIEALQGQLSVAAAAAAKAIEERDQLQGQVEATARELDEERSRYEDLAARVREAFEARDKLAAKLVELKDAL